jgi:hypothetical protein
MRITSGLAALGAGFLAASVAIAADPPDLVGTWKATGESHDSIRLGASNQSPLAEEPTFQAEEHVWSIVITEQKGRAFHGVAKAPDGGEVELVGVASFDGEELLISGGTFGVFGEFVGDGKIEFCYQDHRDDRAEVDCFVAAKE